VKNTAFPYNDSLAYEYFPIREVVNMKEGVIKSKKIINENGE